MSLYACDDDGMFFGYRERIAFSDGIVVCCESGITIPAGQPFALCEMAWCGDPRDIRDCKHDPKCPEVETYDGTMPRCEFLSVCETYPQMLEVWRFLRNNNNRHGACPPFGSALDAYWDQWGYSGEQVDRLRAVGLSATIKRAAKRYREGKGPRLHPSERQSLEGELWSSALPYDPNGDIRRNADNWAVPIALEANP